MSTLETHDATIKPPSHVGESKAMNVHYVSFSRSSRFGAKRRDGFQGQCNAQRYAFKVGMCLDPSVSFNQLR